MKTALPDIQHIRTNGVTLEVYEAGPMTGLPVVLCHGFPELAYSWRYQIDALAQAGFHVIAPNQRGYAGSDKPADVLAYDIHHLTADLTGLLDHFGIDKAVFCGHDWGGLVVWQMPLLHPSRVAGVIGVGVPFLPRAAEDPIVTFRRMWGKRMYIVDFQDSLEADAVFGSDPLRVFDVLMRKNPISLADFNKLPHEAKVADLVKRIQAGPGQGELIGSREDVQFYAEIFRCSGFTGAINWYRNWSRNWSTTAHVRQHISVPSLFIKAGNDLATAAIPDIESLMLGHVDDIEVREVPDSGHWLQQEYPAEVNGFLLDWLQRRF